MSLLVVSSIQLQNLIFIAGYVKKIYVIIHFTISSKAILQKEKNIYQKKKYQKDNKSYGKRYIKYKIF